MIEKMRAVSNPLTIIAIFAALAEVAGTIMLALVDQSIQATFVWFVMLFPVLNVLLFFLTLNFNPKALYAPSDFKDEQNFLLTNGVKQLGQGLMEINDEIHEMKLAIPAEFETKQGAAKIEDDTRKFTDVLERIARIQETVDAALKTSEDLNLLASKPLPNSPLQDSVTEREKQVWKLVSEGKKNPTIADELGISTRTVEVHRARLMEKIGARTTTELIEMYKQSLKSTGKDNDQNNLDH